MGQNKKKIQEVKDEELQTNYSEDQKGKDKKKQESGNNGKQKLQE